MFETHIHADFASGARELAEITEGMQQKAEEFRERGSEIYLEAEAGE